MHVPPIPIPPTIIPPAATGADTIIGDTLDGYEDHSRGLPTTNITWRPDASRILLLCGGADSRPESLANLFRTAAGFEPTNYDTANGPQFDIVDDSVWDTLHAELATKEYV